MGEDGEEEGGEGEREEDTEVGRPWEGERGERGVGGGRKGKQRQEDSNLCCIINPCAMQDKVLLHLFGTGV